MKSRWKQLLAIVCSLIMLVNIVYDLRWEIKAEEPTEQNNMRVDIEKRWYDYDENDNGLFAVIQLLQDGEVINEVRLEGSYNDGAAWFYSFVEDKQGNPLPIYKEDGSPYRYEVEEESCSPGYELMEDGISEEPKEFDYDGYKKYIITNTKEKLKLPNPADFSIKINKTWIIHNYEEHSSVFNREVKFKIYKDEDPEPIREVTMTNEMFSETGECSVIIFEDKNGKPLAKEENGRDIVYRVTEEPVAQEYVIQEIREINEKKEKNRITFDFTNRSRMATDGPRLWEIYVDKKWIGKTGTAEFILYRIDGDDKTKVGEMTIEGNTYRSDWNATESFSMWEGDAEVEYVVEEKPMKDYVTKRVEVRKETDGRDLPALIFSFVNEYKPQEPQNPKKPQDPITPYIPVTPENENPPVVPEEPKVPQGEPNIPKTPEVPETPEVTEVPGNPPVVVPEEYLVPNPIPQGEPELPKTSGLPFGFVMMLGVALMSVGILLKAKHN